MYDPLYFHQYHSFTPGFTFNACGGYGHCVQNDVGPLFLTLFQNIYYNHRYPIGSCCFCNDKYFSTFITKRLKVGTESLIKESFFSRKSLMKLSIRGNILKICISGKVFHFHRDAKYILEYWVDEVNQ